MGELELVEHLDLKDAITLRKESGPAREAFVEQLSTLQAKIGEIPADGNYGVSIQKIIATEIRPAAEEFRNRLITIREKLLGKVAGAAVAWVCSPAVVQVFGDVTWSRVLGIAALGGAFIAKEAIDAHVEKRAARRDCAIS